MKYKELYNKLMPKEKIEEEKHSYIDAYLWRPLSVFVTAPLIGHNVNPTTVTKISIIFSLLGFIVMSFGDNIGILLIGWIFHFLWCLLDCIDGNIARCEKKCTIEGDLWDTMGGYIAMMSLLFSAAIAASNMVNNFEIIPDNVLIVFGGLSAIFSVFPRLMLHKKRSAVKSEKKNNELTDKKNFSLIKIIGLNIIAPSGLMLFLLPFSIITRTLNIFTIFYFIMEAFFCVASTAKVMHD